MTDGIVKIRCIANPGAYLGNRRVVGCSLGEQATHLHNEDSVIERNCHADSSVQMLPALRH